MLKVNWYKAYYNDLICILFRFIIYISLMKRVIIVKLYNNKDTL